MSCGAVFCRTTNSLRWPAAQPICTLLGAICNQLESGVALNPSGGLQAALLYDPYGSVQYSTGTMRGSYGLTGQRADSTTGLDF